MFQATELREAIAEGRRERDEAKARWNANLPE